ncbi:MAG: glycosyltransferase [Deltaproteobacteria bacterium]|nr:glycosyltransferase [Deltaproteobacteria bacterium]
MKVLFITSYFPPIAGGSAVVYYNLCRQLGGEATVLTTWRHYMDGNRIINNGKAPDQGQPFRVKRIELLRPLVQPPSAAHLTQSAWRLLSHDLPLRLGVLRRALQTVREEKVDIVCLGELFALAWLGRMLRRLRGIPCIHYIHGEELMAEKPLRFYSRGALPALRQAEAVIAVSHFTRTEVLRRGVPEDRVHLITNGVDIDRFTPGPKDGEILKRYGIEGKKILLTVGRVERRKGHEAVIRALPRVLGAHPGTVYMIVGEGSDTGRLRSLAREMGLEERVFFTGVVPAEELAKYYRTADLFVMPNRTLENGDTEGFGLVFLEANACGKAVIGGNAGGVPDAIVDGKTGILINGESIETVAHSITRLLEDERLASRMGHAGRERALAFGWRDKANEFRAVCESVLRNSVSACGRGKAVSEQSPPTLILPRKGGGEKLVSQSTRSNDFASVLAPSPLEGEGREGGIEKERMGGMNRVRARRLRKNPTETERALWQHLRLRQIGGHKFRRQQPLGRYIVDFVCLEKHLVVEVDGGQHGEQAQAAHDAERSAWLEQEGFRVLRFWDNEVLREIGNVKEVIWKALGGGLDSPHLDPPPQGGRRYE